MARKLRRAAGLLAAARVALAAATAGGGRDTLRQIAGEHYARYLIERLRSRGFLDK